jgi:uncharacterized protein YndB with AHSA1/START domain
MEATLNNNEAKYVLGLERCLAHPPEKVWRVLTERELIKQWFPCDIEGEWKVGAPLRFEFLHGEGEGLREEDMLGQVLAIDPPRTLEFSWGEHVIRVELVADAGGCRLTLQNIFDDPSWGARNATGWEFCLDNLELLLKGAAAAKFTADVWGKKFEHYVGKFTPTHGNQTSIPKDRYEE